jgi:aryl-alcohol dehydrogenase-like predicted oxidoreductase
MAVLGLGLAALGRPGYLTVDHRSALGPDRSVEALRRRCQEVCDAAWVGGIRWFDAARSYGRAEAFLAEWLTRREIRPGEVTISSKWGYTYTAGWKVDAEVQEVKDHSAAALDRQWPESEALLGRWLNLYQVHSATIDSGILDDTEVHRRLAALDIPVGVSLSGPGQAETLRRAMDIQVDGSALFSAVQATWNLLEPSAGPALVEAKDAGWIVIVKEALANGRLAVPEPSIATLGDQPSVTALAVALSRPWADVVLSGAVTVPQLDANLAAREVTAEWDDDRFDALAIDPPRYWTERSAMTWT